ncbi:MAG: flagellar motor protein MotA [Alphaproteobacteria bacterium]|nr:MAG: flagellar motor protein MotA [Alphaproteobacteria bacterium]
MTRPTRYLAWMVVGLVAVLILGVILFGRIRDAFLVNPALNGGIVAVLLIGIVFVFWQVGRLFPEIAWLESFRRGEHILSDRPPPRLLAPMAAMFGERKGRLSLSALSSRSLLDGVNARLDESHDISRYLISLLVFLGLLGTFWGLLGTISAVGGAVSNLSVDTTDPAALFSQLKSGLQAPLSGMGTAFSSSLFGLAGSLVLGYLELQANQAQNRFYNELEDWLAAQTRLSSGGPIGDAGEQSVPAYIQALLEQTADSLESLQRTMARGEESRIQANTNLQQLTDRLSTLTDQMRTEQQLMIKLAESQSEMRPLLTRLADLAATGGFGLDETSRHHLRNVDVHMTRLIEELNIGRQYTVQELRSEIRLLARTIAALAEEGER